MRSGWSLLLLGQVCSGVLLVSGAYAQSPVSTTYAYDEVGNRTAVTDAIRLTDTRVFSFQPAVVLYGDRVNIFGRNLPVADPGSVAVTIGGVPATILSVAPNVITIEVPQAAATGALVVTLPNQTPADLGLLHIEGLIISPKVSLIALSRSVTVQFTATVVSTVDQSVSWTMQPVPGDSQGQNFGTITPAGLYSPPPLTDLTAAGQLLVRATSVRNPQLSNVALVMIFGTTTGRVSPLVMLPTSASPGALQANPTAGLPLVLLMRPGPGGPGELQVNPTLADPPVQALLPGPPVNEGDLEPSPTVANPPVQALLPGPPGSEGDLEPSPTVANPPVTIDPEDPP